VVLGRVSESEQNTSGRPRELVPERVVGALGSGETSTVREELLDLKTMPKTRCEIKKRRSALVLDSTCLVSSPSPLFLFSHSSQPQPNQNKSKISSTYLSSLSVNLVNGLDSPKVINSRVQPDLVEHQHAGIDGLLIESLHGVRDVRGGNDVDVLVSNGGFDNEGVVGVRDEGNDEIVFGDESVEFGGVGDVDGDGVGTGNGGREGESGGKGSAGCEEGGREGGGKGERRASVFEFVSFRFFALLPLNPKSKGEYSPIVRSFPFLTMYSAAGPATNPLPRRRTFFLVFPPAAAATFSA